MPARAATRYEDDVYKWTREQAAALCRAATSRVNLPEPVDFMNVAEEIESLGISQLNEFYWHYRVLLMHLLKWQLQPAKRSPSWRKTIRTQRDLIARLLRNSPGLKPKRQAELIEAYTGAREDAADETGLPVVRFPPTCPYSLDEAEAAAFWPDEMP